jgi:dihydroxy-acid dehydratase
VLSCRYILELLKSDLKPRDIMTYKAFENAMVTVMATGEASRRRRLY